MTEKDTCPTCGALPCDWVNDPFASQPRPASEPSERAEERDIEAAIKVAMPGRNLQADPVQDTERAYWRPIIEALLAQREQEGWRDIASAPKDGTEFLAFHPKALRFFLACFVPDGRLHNLSVNRWGEATHWMPLPTAPDDAARDCGDATKSGGAVR